MEENMKLLGYMLTEGTVVGTESCVEGLRMLSFSVI
jgi:hypothetical protein